MEPKPKTRKGFRGVVIASPRETCIIRHRQPLIARSLSVRGLALIVFTDTVLSEINAGIAAHEPERGGALFGIKDSNVICHLICDVEANTSRVHYLPSKSLQERVNSVERETNLVFRGIIHSHPGQLSEPSAQDLLAFGKSLSDNPHITAFVAPIVTLEADGNLARHELRLSMGSRMSTYVATRSSKRRWSLSCETPHLERSAVTIMPIEEHMTLLCSALGTTTGAAQTERGYFAIGHVFYISVSTHFRGVEIIALFPPIYPLAQPLVMISTVGRAPTFADLPFGAEFNSTLDRPQWILKLVDLVQKTEGYDGKPIE